MKDTFKNYIVLLLIFVGVVVLLIYIKSWSNTYKVDKYSKSYLSDLVEEVKLSELEMSTKEMNEVFLLITKTNDKNIYKREKKIYSNMKSMDLIDKFIYVDVTSDKDYLSKLNSILGNFSIKELPTLLYIKNGEVVNVVEDITSVKEIKSEYQL